MLNTDQQPVAVGLVRSTKDVAAVVSSAADSGLQVLVQGTGHGAGPVGPLTRTVLGRTAALNAVQIDPEARTAWIGAGCEWQGVSMAAAEHGLAAQAGSAADWADSLFSDSGI